MSKILLPGDVWTEQPQYRVKIAAEYIPYVSTARVWNLPPTLGIDARLDNIGAFAKTGTIAVATSSGGVGVKGDGSTGLYSRTTSVVPQAMWMAVQFVCNSVSTTHKTVYALGSAAASTGAFVGISSGINSTDSNINSQFRSIDSGVIIAKLGPVPVVGGTYTIVAVFPSGLKADAYLYVNGVKYTTDYASSADISFAGATTLVNESAGALKRGTTALYTNDTILFTARGTGRIPEPLARQISENPYSLLTVPKRNIWVDVSGGTSVSVDVTGLTGTTALGDETVTAIQNASTSVTGLLGTSALGTVSVTAIQNASTSVTGLTGTSALGSVTVDVGGSTSVSVTGLLGTSALGTVSVTAVRNTSTSVTGLLGTSALGSVTVTTGSGADVSVNVTGLSGTASLGTVLVWGLVDTAQTPNWLAINTTQTPNWTRIAT